MFFISVLPPILCPYEVVEWGANLRQEVLILKSIQGAWPCVEGDVRSHGEAFLK